MKAAMEIAGKNGKELSVPLPGGVWTRREFVVFDGATEAQLCQAVRQMSALNLSSRWALGDLGMAIQERKRAEFAKQAKALRESAKRSEDAEHRGRLLKQAEGLEGSRMDTYTRELADVLEISDGYWRDCVQLARFYPPSERSDAHGITPAHHHAAMKAAGGAGGKLATAQQWIAQATKDALTAAELRKKVNLSLATSRPPAKPAERNEFEALDAADQWAIAHKGLLLTPEQGEVLRVRWSALADFMARLAKA